MPRRAEAPVGAPLSPRSELHRKAIHIASAVLPALAWTGPRALVLPVLLGLAAVASLVDLARLRVPRVRRAFLRLTHPLLRKPERRALSGATHMAVAYAAAAVLFPLPVAVAAMLYNALGDAAGALVGAPFGRIRIAAGKSAEGTLAVFAVCLGVGWAVPGIPAGAALLGAAAAAFLEAVPVPVNDNLRITLGGGAALWAAVLLLG
jgi:dolichol kinase